MKILIACEESQVVCKAFRARGHEAYSCDVQECSGGRPEWHIQGDVRLLLNERWDMMIAHPPCTYICRHRSRWNTETDIPDIQKGQSFFNELWLSNIPKICVENPVPSKVSGLYQSYTQIIQPWQFGHDYSKKTCLWLKNLTELRPTKIVKITYVTTENGRRFTAGWYRTPRNSKARSKTFPGIADAMAELWG